MADRIILHSDLNCFYASVEVNENPKLRDQAIAVCGSTEERHGIVLTASYPAKRRGVKTGMANWQAVRACPGLICVPPHYELYDQWAKRGFIQTTEGNVVHYGFIERFICELGERYNIREIAHDRWNATMMVQTLEDDGFTMVPFGQGFRDMSPPTKELMRLVLEHKLCHGGHPVLRWNMDNAYVRTDPAGNLKLDKEKSTEKVDGAVALVMALDRAMKNLNGGDSVYNHRGFLVL